jgi:arylsulfatase A
MQNDNIERSLVKNSISRSVILLTIISIMAGLYSCDKNIKNSSKPNIVLIMADDMGYECLGCNGSTEYDTPNLDRLASEGIRFEHCYSQPLCTPSRVKIMTGKFNFRNYEDFGYLNPAELTFGNLMKEAGYATCIAGKWQLNGLNRNNPGNQDVTRPVHFGFDEYCLWQLNRTRAEGERYASPLITQNGNDRPQNSEEYGPQVFSDYILDFIERKAEFQPFFIYYPMVLVHDPFVPTPDSPEWSNPSLRYKKDTAFYSDMMAYTDKIAGQIIEKLKEKEVWNNTLLIFTADNGTHPTVISTTKNGDVKGGKGKTINTGNHVPMIISWPKTIKKASICKNIIDFSDILPTLADAAGIGPESYVTDGESFIKFLSGKYSKFIKNEIFIHYSPRWGTFHHNRWVMDGKYKLYRDGRFFNTESDPYEQDVLSNLSENEKKTKEHFRKILDEKEKEFPFSMNDREFRH